MEENNNPLPHFDPEKKIWEDILNNPVKSLSPENDRRVMKNLYRQIEEYEKKKKQKKLKFYLTAAVITLLFIVSGLTAYNIYIKPDVYLGSAQGSKIKLIDGSTVTLLNGAKLTVEKSFPADTREVYLEGNAVFQITKSKVHPFIVHGLNYQTKVLGTVFKVFQGNGVFKVDLYEGKVAVKKADAKQEYFLKPNQTFNNYGKKDIAVVVPFKVSQAIVPAFGKDENADNLIQLSFSKSMVRDVIEVIEKSYNIKIQYPAEYANRIITVDNKNVSPESILNIIAAYLDLKINKYDSIYKLEK